MLTAEEIEELTRRGNLYDGHVTNGSSASLVEYINGLITKKIQEAFEEYTEVNTL